MGKKGLSGKIVTEYLEKFPDAQTLTLARLIYADNKEVFSDVESVRSRIRYHRGSTGVRDRKALKSEKFIRPLQTGKNTFKKLPKGITTLTGWGNYRLLGDHRILILSDAHIPFHNKDV